MQGFWPTPEHKIEVQDSIPIEILCKAAAASLTVGMLVETVATAGTDADRKDITAATALSKTALGYINYNLENKRTLGKANSVATKDTGFADDDGIWVSVRIPVVEAILTSSQGTCLPGQRYCAGGDGFLIKHPDNLAVSTHTTGTTVTNTVTGTPLDPTVAIGISRATTGSTTQRFHVMPLW